jgi:hypothetical protein
MKHGERCTYVHLHCRCDLCRKSNADYCANRRVQRSLLEPTVHGKYSTYVNYGCRCGPCTRANSEQSKDYYQRKFDVRPSGTGGCER